MENALIMNIPLPSSFSASLLGSVVLSLFLSPSFSLYLSLSLPLAPPPGFSRHSSDTPLAILQVPSSPCEPLRRLASAEFSNSQGCIDDAGRRHGSGRSQHPRCHSPRTFRTGSSARKISGSCRHSRVPPCRYWRCPSTDTALRRDRKLIRYLSLAFSLSPFCLYFFLFFLSSFYLLSFPLYSNG